MKNPKLLAATLIFVACLCIGFWIAGRKALWTDEYYSQAYSVEKTSYARQFSGHVPEGGNAPLFYALQKTFLRLVHYRTPGPWFHQNWCNDTFSQIILRINPVFFMSLSVGLVFYYFCRNYSWGTAFLSLLIYFSSHMLWAYWAEARPYALWVFLTTVQSMILLRRDSRWILLAMTNILLSLTSIMSLGQIVTASVLWWAFRERDWKKYLLITLLPAMIAVFYYMQAPKYHFFFGASGSQQLIQDNIPKERFEFLLMFLFFACLPWITLKEELLRPLSYVIFTALVIAGSVGVLCLFAAHATRSEGFPVTSRYFIYLTPISVIVSTLLIVSIIKSLSKYQLLQWAMTGVIGFLLMQRFLKVVPHEILSVIGAH